MFGERLTEVMEKKDISVTKLSRITGIPKPSISQYRSGKTLPTARRMVMLGRALGVTFDEQDLKPQEVERIKRISVDEVAQAFHVGHDTIRKGLQQHVFPWGYAVQTTPDHWVYIINGDKFEEIEGVKLEAEESKDV